jgi:penicillin-binding protein 1B
VPPRRHKRGWLRALRPWLLLAVGIGVAFAVTAFFLLDARVRTQFGATQWRLPAHVYTQPVELHDGRQLTRAALVAHLEAVGYQRGGDLSRPGRYAVQGTRVRLHTRPFVYPDGRAPARRLTVRFDGDRIARVDTQGGAAALARVQPQRMGSIYPGRREDRILVRGDAVPPLLVEALIAVEDRDFRSHHGVQPSAILRAAMANLRAGRAVQGGSTLTQQLVKNFFLTNEQTLSRKFTEALMALSLEWHYSKQQILNAYLNEVYLGQDDARAIHGFGLGAQFWFNRPLAELKLRELALLVGLVKGPSHFDPRAHPERARKRRNTVLALLAEQGVIAPARAEKAQDRPLGVVAREAVQLAAYPAYLDLVRRQLARDYRETDLRSGGLRVFTHLDATAQRAAEQAVARRLPRLGGQGELQAAAVVADYDSGAVRALVGGREDRRGGYNRALSAQRSVGSLIKPAVYYTALNDPQRYTLATRIDDSPLKLERDGGAPWQPQNYSGEFHGDIALYEGLLHSYNAATARLGLDIGLERIAPTLAALDAAPGRALVPADLLGSLSLTPFRVAGMYQTLAAGGFDTPLSAIAAVQGPDGETLSRDALEVERVLEPAPTFLVNTVLERVTRTGTARALERLLPNRRLAGKTGTTNALRDSWFAGFDGRRVGVVWVGRDNNRPTGLTGNTGALRVWADMMRDLAPVSPSDAAPPGVVWARVDGDSGRALPDHCEAAMRLPFIDGSVPGRAARCNPDAAHQGR